jgi:signal transduction histidine kinase/HPt (histidine-containing phosphotransfer) domain-containing protein
MDGSASSPSTEALLAEIAKLRKINAALVARVERSMNAQGTAFSLFASATSLESEVRQRTAALHTALRDLTASNRAALLARDAADAASRAKSEFLARMSHEIRTPMNGVLGVMDLLMTTELTARQHQLLRTAQTSALALLRIIDDILDFTKIDCGKLELERIDFAPAAVIHEVVELLSEIATRKGLELRAELTGDLPRSVVGDPLRLRQVLLNLVGNALKFTERGSVTIGAQRVLDGNGGVTLRFDVRDTGIGIADSVRAHVFDVFAQADGSTTRRHGGTGLGLAIVRDLVRLMGGEIRLESAPGAGSRFWFDARFERGLGTRMVAAVDPDAVALDRLPRLGLRVLVAEDNATNRAVLCGMLEQLGCTYDEVADGRAAVDAALSRHYDVILMDWQMPELDGLEAAAEIRAHEQRAGEARRRIVAVTANVDASHRDRCLAHGMDAFVSKPLRLQALARALGQTPAPTRLDDDALAELGALDPGGGLLRQVLELFVGDAAQRVAEIASGVDAGDRARVAAAAHQLKSSSAYVGATELARTSAEIEAAARSDRPLAALVERLATTHASAVAAVRKLRAELG